MEEALSIAAACLLGGFLILSALAKAAHPKRVRTALESLVNGRRVATPLGAPALIAAEWAVGTSLIVRPWDRAVQAAVAVLFLVFAAAGGFALATGRTIECGCFGGLRASRLGRLQLIQLPVVLGCLFVIDLGAPHRAFASGLIALFLVHVAVAILLLAGALPAWRKVRRDRISLGIGVEYTLRQIGGAAAAKGSG
jgi:hypothetical protein